MELRKDRWQETSSSDKLANFRWQQLSRGIAFDQVNSCGTRQLVNHIQNHALITTKHQLFSTLVQYCETKRLDVFQYLPLTFPLQMDNDLCLNELEKFIQYFNAIKKAPEDVNTKFGHSMQLPYSMRQNDKTQRQQCAKYLLKDTFFTGQNVWILKATEFNRGVGIHVFNSLQTMGKLLREYAESAGHYQNSHIYRCIQRITKENPADDSTTQISSSEAKDKQKSLSFVVQKYLERPLLLNQRKFDIRVWALLTQENKLFFFQEGYVRTSSVEYTLEQSSIQKPEIHLTNIAVQKFSQDYGKYEDGNILSFA